MKGITIKKFGGPEVLEFEELESFQPDENQLMIKIEAAGINPVDTYIRNGTHAQKPDLPYTPGKDAAGTVAAVGSNISGLSLGDRVFTSGSLTGTYAEYCLCSETQAHKLPENVSFEQGAGVFIPYATSYRALFQKANAKSGETVLIHGASGGVGIAAVQWAKHAGLRVIGTASSHDGKKIVKEQGADHVFDHSDESYFDEIKEVTNGNGVDVILEMLANENLSRDFEVLAMFGRITVIGNRGSVEFNPRLAMGKDATILGMSLFNAPSASMSEIHAAIFEGLGRGYLNPIVGKFFPLQDAAEAHRAVIEQKAMGKIVLIP